MAEIFFEDYKVSRLCIIPSAILSAFDFVIHNDDFINAEKNITETAVILVDCGYSFTHIVPIYIPSGKIISSAVFRIDIGGKFLTNRMKEIISYRYLNVQDETYIVNQIKEDICCVSLDFPSQMKELAKYRSDLRKCQLSVQYFLPDYEKIQRGYFCPASNCDRMKDNTESTQKLMLSSERITVPELLFRPSDIGLDQIGVSEAIVESVNRCPIDVRPKLLANIFVTGGSAKIPNFAERIQIDVQSMVPDVISVKVQLIPDNDSKFGESSEIFQDTFVTQSQFSEQGSSIIHNNIKAFYI